MSAILFDLGGTYLRCGISNSSGTIKYLKKTRIESFIHGHKPDLIWEKIIARITAFTTEMKEKVSVDAPIVISFPGPVAKPSKIISAPTITGEAVMLPDLSSELTRRTGRTTNIINDISAAAWYFSRIIDVNRLIVVTISSGIGSKIFDRNHPLGVLDDIPYAGEIGHVKIDNAHKEILCNCGGKGHLGAISSGRGIENFARRMAKEQPDSFRTSACLSKFGGKSDCLTNEDHLVPAALIGDAWTLNIIRECTYPLAKVLLQLISAIGLEKVIIIGGFAMILGKIYGEILQSLLIELCDFSVMADQINDIIYLGNDKEEACLEGAAIFAQQFLGLSS